MPTPSNNFSRYKIPDVINPSGVCCICVPVPDNREYRAQFMGAIWRMSLQTNYERDDAHSAQLVAAVWRKIWEDLQVSDCGCSPTGGSQDLTIINLQVQILIEAWKQTWIDALFDIDVAFPLTPDFFDSDPGDAGPEIAQRDRALCLAVSSWVDELFNRGLGYAEEAGLTVAGLVAGGLALPSVPTYVVTTGLVATAFALSELAVELASTAYRDYIKCGMLQDLRGKDTNSPSDFAESWDNLPVRPPPPESIFQDIARDAIEAWGRSQLNNVDNYIGFIQTLNVAMGVASSLTDADCAPCEGWEHTWVGGFNEAGDWTLAVYTTGWALTTYNAGADRFEGTCVTNAVVGARVKINFAATEITRVRVSSEWGSVRATASQNTDIWSTFDPPAVPPTVIHECSHGTGEGSHVCDTGAISLVISELNIRSAAGVFGCPNPAAWTYITKIIVNGNGTDPFI